MISKTSKLKLVFAVIIVLIGGIYWYFARQKTGPVEAVQDSINASQY
jgi:cbb3-type cytochrome oxidase subunit 3